jgi:hypothetical protein
LAIGARVEVEVVENGNTRKIYETVSTGSSFGGNSLQLEIGLGKADAIKSVTVNWPSRSTTPQVFHEVALNSAYSLREGEKLVRLSYSHTPFQKNKLSHTEHH